MVAGCAQPSKVDAEAQPHGFEARYADPLGKLSVVVRLDGPVKIRDLDLEWVDAYRMSARGLGSDGSPGPGWLYYLDGNLNLLRLDQPGDMSFSPDYPLDSASWRLRGFAAPFGLGLPGRLEGAKLPQAVWGTQLPVPATTQLEGDALTVRLGDRTELEDNGLLTFPANFTFQSEQLAPLSYQYPGVPLTRLASIQDLGALPAIAPMRDLFPKPQPGSYQELFPGAGEDVQGWGVTIQDALAELRRQKPEADRALGSGGCITFASSHKPTPFATTLGLLEDNSLRLFQFRIYPRTGEGREWDITQYQEQLNGETWVVRGPRPVSAQTCDAAKSPLETRISLRNHQAALSALPHLASENVSTFTWSHSASSRFPSRFQEQVFSSHFANSPESAASFTIPQSQSASTGYWLGMGARNGGLAWLGPS